MSHKMIAACLLLFVVGFWASAAALVWEWSKTSDSAPVIESASDKPAPIRLF